MLNAIAYRMTPAAAGSPVPSEEPVHGNVTFEEPSEEEKSDRSPDDVSTRFTGEFNSVERPSLSQRIPGIGNLNVEETPTDSRFAFQSSTLQRPSRSVISGREETTLETAHNLYFTSQRSHYTGNLNGDEMSTDHRFFSAPNEGRFGVAQSSAQHRDPTVDELSVRLGRHEVQNVTERDTKRQRDRPKDVEYKRRFSTSELPVNFSPSNDRYSAEQEFSGGPTWPRRTPEASTRHVITSDLGQRGVVRSGRLAFSPVPSIPQPSSDDVRFTIKLIHAGQTVVHSVWEQMPIAQLAEEAGVIFGLDPEFVILMLFTALPQTLDKSSRIAGPPRVFPDSSVFVFCFGSSPEHRSTYGTQPPPITGRGVDHGTYPQFQQQPRSSYVPDPVLSQGLLLNSKLFGTFKLPKFNGVPRNWKI